MPKSSMASRTPMAAQALDHGRELVVVEHDPVGDLELHLLRIETGLADVGGDGSGHVRVAQLAGGQVQREPQRAASVAPRADLGEGVSADPTVHLHDEARFLRDRKERGRGQQAQGRVLPADEGLDPHCGSRLRVDLGLVDDPQLVIFDRSVQRALQVEDAARVSRALGPRDDDGVPSRAFASYIAASA